MSQMNKNIHKQRPTTIERSIHGEKFIWKLPEENKSDASSISSKFNLSYPVASFLCSRGMSSDEDFMKLLTSLKERDVGDPNLLADSEVAVERILSAIKNKEKILIFGDYDVDGVTSTSLFLLALSPLGVEINFFLPDRYKDGYGLSKWAIKKAHDSGYKLVITVDNGITALEEALYAKELGVDLIVTDHHEPHEKLPEALAVVDPKRSDCLYPFKDLSGVGVAFKVVALIYEKLGKKLPERVYELLTLGTIADVVPLLGENRYWVQDGIARMKEDVSLPIKELAANCEMNERNLNSTDIAFMIAPQINALGRMSNPRNAVTLLTSSDPSIIKDIASDLKIKNEQRKKIEMDLYREIEQAIERGDVDLKKELVIMVASSDWPTGIIGLVAGRVAKNYGRPTFLFHVSKDGIAKGSCRSAQDINIFDLLKPLSGMMIKFGGHAAAAGLSIHKDNLFEFKTRLEEAMAKRFKPEDLVPQIKVDADLDLIDMNKKLVDDLDRLEPYGNKNEKPVFLVDNLSQIKTPSLLKDKHVKIFVFSQGIIKPVIFFQRPELISFFRNLGETQFKVAAQVTKNEWGGVVSSEFHGLDVAR